LVLIIALSVTLGSIIMMILDKKKNRKPYSIWELRSEPTAPHFLPSRIAHDHFWRDLGLLIGTGFVYVQITSGFTYAQNSLSFYHGTLKCDYCTSTIVVLESLTNYIGSRRINDRLLSQANIIPSPA
jgi:lipoprotein-releasing system permease protein